MKFTFKMLVLVGMIMVGKFLKDDNSAGIVKEQNKANQEAYTLKATSPLPFTQNTNEVVQPVTKEETTEKTFTYSLN